MSLWERNRKDLLDSGRGFAWICETLGEYSQGFARICKDSQVFGRGFTSICESWERILKDL